MGTDPNNAADFPDQSTLPAVQFKEALSSAVEGSGVHNVLLEITPGFSGTVHYTINPRSTASAPGDFQTLSGTLNVSGTQATIPISTVDDTSVSEERLIVIDLETDPIGGGYRRGGRASHVVCLTDNDCYYNGTLIGDEGERNFRMRILRGPGSISADFVAGSADGLDAPAGIGSSQTAGVIPTSPQNTWNATGVIDTPTRFRAISPDMPANAGGLFTKSAQLERRLTLDATDPAFINDESLLGTYTETITSNNAAKTYLNKTSTGDFILLKAFPLPADIDSEFQP